MKRLVQRKVFALLLAFTFALCVVPVKAQRPDFGNTKRYAKANSELPALKKGEKRVVLFGNSITELWYNTHPNFFKSHGYIGRGIGGQTSYQFLLRFREDVVNLKPALVVINAGTNDVAENVCDYNEDLTFGNIVSMVDIARANRIKVIMTTVLPAAKFGWNTKITDAPAKIASLNSRLKKYALANKIPFVDYFTPLVDTDGKTLNPKYSQDGVHPLASGYDVMESIIVPVIKKTL